MFPQCLSEGGCGVSGGWHFSGVGCQWGGGHQWAGGTSGGWHVTGVLCLIHVQKGVASLGGGNYTMVANEKVTTAKGIFLFRLERTTVRPSQVQGPCTTTYQEEIVSQRIPPTQPDTVVGGNYSHVRAWECFVLAFSFSPCSFFEWSGRVSKALYLYTPSCSSTQWKGNVSSSVWVITQSCGSDVTPRSCKMSKLSRNSYCESLLWFEVSICICDKWASEIDWKLFRMIKGPQGGNKDNVRNTLFFWLRMSRLLCVRSFEVQTETTSLHRMSAQKHKTVSGSTNKYWCFAV